MPVEGNPGQVDTRIPASYRPHRYQVRPLLLFIGAEYPSTLDQGAEARFGAVASRYTVAWGSRPTGSGKAAIGNWIGICG